MGVFHMKHTVLIVGNSGLEHVLAQMIPNSDNVQKVFIAPGNGWTGTCGENVPIEITL
jgi:phosphoribosylamine---glycine ligase